jgi:hypothetical protein
LQKVVFLLLPLFDKFFFVFCFLFFCFFVFLFFCFFVFLFFCFFVFFVFCLLTLLVSNDDTGSFVSFRYLREFGSSGPPLNPKVSILCDLFYFLYMSHNPQSVLYLRQVDFISFSDTCNSFIFLFLIMFFIILLCIFIFTNQIYMLYVVI